ncbi:MAG TPA: Rne/Rng family ribonuclease [Pseudolabrys sp.]|nr:Rne/Rng family ribonuclease [Pseudolabrys sp.]
MADKMLIDATHPEETRVVVLRGNRVEEFDFESANRKQLRGNIYLAKVTRVEPSLQAAFVDYGGNRHGFLAFSEIHPDYYQIPVADRQALLAQEEHDQREAEAEADSRERRRGRRESRRGASHTAHDEVMRSELLPDEGQTETEEATSEHSPGELTSEVALDDHEEAPSSEAVGEPEAPQPDSVSEQEPNVAPDEFANEQTDRPAEVPVEMVAEAEQPSAAAEGELNLGTASAEPFIEDSDIARAENGATGNGNGEGVPEEEAVESVGGADALEEVQERVPRFRRQYKIQEVIKRRQVLLVQVVKEERGTKGAALTTYLSLAGRYSVLMPNTARGGGISRKITSVEDRMRLKEIAQDLEVPEGMGVILRTAGASRTKTEVKRDFEYLLRLWETVRDLTLKSTAPKLVYEEGSLIKRSIRDLYTKDIEEIIVAGEEGYKEAREFMRMLMPSHAKHVKQYKDSQPLFTRYGIESQLDAMFSPVVQLRSGGYIVINQAEALVAIDVNSGRATREHHIEDTALKTNCEAAEEIARQLRLRDLAGLIVIDFIDMDEGRNNRTVERRLKEALKHDRARIQVGRISHFGLLEMSRQRIRTSVLESSTEKCPLCGGSGHVRSVSSVALQLLRAVEEMLIKGATHNLIVRTRAEVALYVLNHKRAHLRMLEERFRVTITVSADPTVSGQQSYAIDRGEQVHTPEAARALAAQLQAEPIPLLAEDGRAETDETSGQPEDEVLVHAQQGGAITRTDREREGASRRRRRRGRGGRGRDSELREEAHSFVQETVPEHLIEHEDHNGGPLDQEGHGPPHQSEEARPVREGELREGRRRRRRGRRGGRRNRRNGDDAFRSMEVTSDMALQDAPTDVGQPSSESAPAYSEAPREPPPSETDRPAPEERAPQLPRRGSTIREPAPLPAENTPAPTPSFAPASDAPVVSSSGTDQSPPKRGWWGRRLLGDK